MNNGKKLWKPLLLGAMTATLISSLWFSNQGGDRRLNTNNASEREKRSIGAEEIVRSNSAWSAATPPPNAPIHIDGNYYNSDLTTGQWNALTSAKSYLRYSSFSRDGLIDQLLFEKYSLEDATYAADNCGADWSEQALKSAVGYLNYSAFSHTGLIGQLEFEKFTAEQATYAADNCGADWYEQAAKSAKSYLAFSSFSRDGLISQLEFEGFTHEQAVYGAAANGY